jgi:uncharacterized Fe-S cluster protein YjdI
MAGDDVTRTYSNGEVTVIWRRGLCIHSTECFQVLPRVFDPRRRPWVDVGAAPSEAIEEQVRQCPSGALSCVRHDPALGGTPPGGAGFEAGGGAR